MHPITRRLLTLLFPVLCTGSVSATHFHGGEMTYKFLGTSTTGQWIYQIRLDYYQDCHTGDPNAIGQDNPAFLGIFDGNGTRILVDSIRWDMPPSEAPADVPVNFIRPCITTPAEHCLKKASFVRSYTLPPSFNGYTIVNQRCCLSFDIVNLVNPGATGLTLYARIPPAGSVQTNNSAVFRNRGPVYFCKGLPFHYDHGATDADGDSLAYRLVTTYRGGTDQDAKPFPSNINFQLVTYAAPASGSNPMNGRGSLSIDPRTGGLSGIADSAGAYLVSVACDEYRGGVVINTVTRSYVYEIGDCQVEVSARVESFPAAASLGLDSIFAVACGGARTVQFKNASTGAQSYLWDFGDPTRTDDQSTAADPSYTYPGPGKYGVTLIAQGTNCADTIRGYAIISDDQISVDFTVTGGPCIYDTLLFEDHSSGSPIALQGWEINNQVLFGAQAVYASPVSGRQTVRHIVQTTGGCIGMQEREINVNQAGIRAGNDTSVIKGTMLQLHATGGVSYHWNGWNPLTISNPDDADPVINCSTAGNRLNYYVIGTDAQGCRGMDSINITVTERGYVYVPTAFSPNGDGLNDNLRAYLSNYNFVEIRIYNRTGQVVYYSRDLSTAWDGSFKGKPAAADVYFWMVKVTDASGNPAVFKGDVTLVR